MHAPGLNSSAVRFIVYIFHEDYMLVVRFVGMVKGFSSIVRYIMCNEVLKSLVRIRYLRSGLQAHCEG